jgi:FKBP-type peptidyl-prolyl cis-trans isomerase FkpA
MNKVFLAILSVVMLCGMCADVNAQAKKPNVPKKAAPGTKTISDGYKNLEGGASYKIMKDAPGKNLEKGEFVAVNITVMADTQVLQSSRRDNQGKPITIPVAEPQTKSDVIAKVLPKTSPGDSVVIKILMDSILATAPQNPPAFLQKGKYIWMYISVEGRRTKEEYQAESDAKRQDRQKKIAEMTAKQRATDDSMLQDYFKRNNITPKKTEKGLYYVIHNEGTGENIQKGQKPSVNYTGKLLDGKMFDSNTDSSRHHVAPFEFTVGKGMVIAGWDEGVTLLKKGTKATLYIPSGLGYGTRGQGKDIPANSILVFDMEVVDVKIDLPGHQKVIDDSLIQDYCKKNNINAQKTASGLYYSIQKEGTGDNIKKGQKPSINYTGRLLNGKMFDSNTDPAKGHVTPFEFTAGQGMVIQGWDEGVTLMKKGTKATLYIPSELGYGERGQREIPANSVLVFDMEVLDIK